MTAPRPTLVALSPLIRQESGKARFSRPRMNAVSSRYIGLLYAAPAILFVLAFLVYPLGQLFYTSLTSASLLGGGEWVGFRNYVRAWNDPQFWTSLLFTLKYTLYITPILM